MYHKDINGPVDLWKELAEAGCPLQMDIAIAMEQVMKQNGWTVSRKQSEDPPIDQWCIEHADGMIVMDTREMLEFFQQPMEGIFPEEYLDFMTASIQNLPESPKKDSFMINMGAQNEFYQQMLELQEKYGNDPERCHEEMDDCMMVLLESLGFTKGVEIFRNSKRWYA